MPTQAWSTRLQVYAHPNANDLRSAVNRRVGCGFHYQNSSLDRRGIAATLIESHWLWRQDMAEERFLFAVVTYKPIHVDQDYRMSGGKEFNRKFKACDKAFQRFEQLRGEILSQAIAVENELDRVISWYFVPRLTPIENDLRREEDLRRDALVDLVLGQESFTVSSKIETVASIFPLAEIQRATPTKLRNTLKPVLMIRNQFAHRKVGVHWQTQDIALWDAKKRKWGFPDFDSEGKTSRGWLDRIPGNLGDLYSRYCKVAITVVHDVWKEIHELRNNNPIQAE